MLSTRPTNQDMIAHIEAVTDNAIQMRLTTGLSTPLSILISQELRRDYDSLCALFTAIRADSLENFIALRRIDKAKELLVYTDQSLDEIALVLDYGTSKDLLNQLVQHTGMSADYYRDIRQNKQAIQQNLETKHKG